MKRNILIMLLCLSLLLGIAPLAQAECYGHWVSCGAGVLNTCEGCGETNVLCEIVHNFGDYEYDANSHWNTCLDCGEKCYEESHFALCFNPTVCDICGATGLSDIELGHPNFVVKSDARECWGECADCGVESFRGSHYTFCIDQGKCSYCGYPGVGFTPYHAFEAFANGTHHWKECTECGEKTNEGLHSAPCSAPDKCQECGGVFDAITLSHTEVVDEAVAPTCTETGLTEGKHCSVCGYETVPRQIISKLYHKWNLTSSTPATCTESGNERYDCSRCGYYYVDRPAPLGHQFDEYLSQMDGTHMAICALCDQGVVENCQLAAGTCAVCGYVAPVETLATGVPCVECENETNPEEEISLEVVDKTSGIAAQDLPAAAQNAVHVFEVTLRQNGQEMIPQGNVIIRLPIENEASLEGLKLMLLLEDGTMAEIAYEIQDGMIVFKTDQTGTFVFLP